MSSPSVGRKRGSFATGMPRSGVDQPSSGHRVCGVFHPRQPSVVWNDFRDGKDSMSTSGTVPADRVVDTDRYPLSDPDGPEWRAVVARTRAELDAVGCCV